MYAAFQTILCVSKHAQFYACIIMGTLLSSGLSMFKLFCKLAFTTYHDVFFASWYIFIFTDIILSRFGSYMGGGVPSRKAVTYNHLLLPGGNGSGNLDTVPASSQANQGSLQRPTESYP